jgi:hydrogenase expression/formation protein HypC
MCLAVPAQVVELFEDDVALVDTGGIRSHISVALIDGVQPGDYVIVHVGHALTKLDVAEAEKTLALFAELAEAIGESPDAVYPRVS